MKKSNLFFVKTAYFWALLPPIVGIMALSLRLIPSLIFLHYLLLATLFFSSIISLFIHFYKDFQFGLFAIIRVLLVVFLLIFFLFITWFSAVFGHLAPDTHLFYENQTTGQGFYYENSGFRWTNHQSIFVQKYGFSPFLTSISECRCPQSQAYPIPKVTLSPKNIGITTCDGGEIHFFY
jgi:hypothetical protein